MERSERMCALENALIDYSDDCLNNAGLKADSPDSIVLEKVEELRGLIGKLTDC